MNFLLPLEYEKYSAQILDVLENKIFELDTMHRFGLVEFKLIFQDRESLSKKKTKKLIDLREWNSYFFLQKMSAFSKNTI